MLAGLLLTGAAALLHGQAVTGSLLGTVIDSSSAAVPGAKVEIVETNTGISRSTQTNESGNYSFPTLEPGTYRVSAAHEGFRTAVKVGLVVLVNTAMRADLSLQPGAVTETVTVTAEVPLLQTDRSDTGRKIETVQLANIPLAYNRNFQAMLNLAPGTTRSFQPHSEFFNSQGSLTTQVNGVQRQGNNVQFEGVDNNHRTGLLTVLIPPIEAIETADISTSNYEAELGRGSGAVTNIMLKSGTNDLHGAAYWFNKTSAMAARETFSPGKAVTTYNYYGFNIGGPIRKNKTFFFGDFLQTKDRRGDSYIITIPTQEFRNGDFSSVLSSGVAIYNPLSGDPKTGAGRQPFANNQIPGQFISPIAKKIMAMIPLPNFGSGILNNYAGATSRIKDSDSFDVKVDHQQTDKDRFAVRYSLQRPVVTDPARFGAAMGGGKDFSGTGVNRTQSAAVNYTRLFSPTLIMEARVGLGRYSNVAKNLDYGTKASDELGIKGVNLDAWTSGLARIDADGLSNPFIGTTASLPWNRAETNFNWVNNWTKVARNHTIKFGADIRRLREELLQTQNAGGPRGQITFSRNQTSISGAKTLDPANGIAALLLDFPSQLQRDMAVMFPSIRSTMVFLYGQDKWVVTPKLTVDLGLRWEFYPPFTPRFAGGFSNYDPETNTWQLAGVGPFAKNMGRKTYYRDFAPRLGLAYRLNAKTVIRTGFGISWFPFPDNKYPWDNFPVKQSVTYNNLTTGGQAVTPDGALLSMSTGFPAPIPATIPTSGILPVDRSASVSAMVPLDYHEGYVESWNFAVQRQFPKNFSLDAAYVANHTVRGPVRYNINAAMTFNSGAAGRPLYQKFGRNVDTLLRYKGLSNNYESLQIKLDRRFSGGFLMTTAYTWSHALGYGRTDDDSGLWNYINPERSYGRLDFDRRQSFVQSYVYELPFGKNKPFLKTGPGRWILGDWQVAGVLTLMTGRPFTVGTSVSINTPGANATADITGPMRILHGVAGPGGSNLWFDTANFSQPLDADGKTPHWGNTGYNAFSGPGMFDLDFSLFRRFRFGERLKGELRAESMNLTNTPAFGNPNTNMGSADFGKVTGTLAGLIANQGVGGTGARQIQLGLKLTF